MHAFLLPAYPQSYRPSHSLDITSIGPEGVGPLCDVLRHTITITALSWVRFGKRSYACGMPSTETLCLPLPHLTLHAVLIPLLVSHPETSAMVGL